MFHILGSMIRFARCDIAKALHAVALCRARVHQKGFGCLVGFQFANGKRLRLPHGNGVVDAKKGV
ncbi:hypothetical protein GCM10007879_09870 [Maritalea porphyrae]|uniref:Uncharacterized protein n=1 Tax=Maritalea porphyrae TaxID=880732 RepID=A0ABQ5UND3_9HYPH|nr:hypothetical protein GCM10007879_09870 [Maritalea porphyrae]